MARAGDTPLLSAFTHGNVVLLQAQSSRQYLRIVDGSCDGNGGTGKYAQFIVHVRRPGVVALQSVADVNRWLAIHDGRITGTGHGGPFCDFLVGELDGRFIVLESCQSPGQRVGVQADGKMLLPYNTGTGLPGRFIPIVFQYAPQQPQGFLPPQPQAAYPPQPQAAYPPQPQPYPPTQPYPPQPQTYPPQAPSQAPPPYTAPSPQSVIPLCVGTTPVLSCFTEGNIIFLHCQASCKNLRITQTGVVEGIGGNGKLAQFSVHVRRQGVAALQNVFNPSHWLSIDGGLTRCSNGDQYCDFYVKDLDGQHIALESVLFPGCHVGVLPDGTMKLPNQTSTGPHGRFIPSVFYKNPQPPSMPAPPLEPTTAQVYNPPPPPPSSQYPSPYPPPSVGAPQPSKSLLEVFGNGAQIHLRARSTGRNLRLKNGHVDGNGGEGQFAKFLVSVKHPGVVSLQSMADTSKWLRVTDKGNLDGKGAGHAWTVFTVKQISADYVALESVSFPSWHVGILPSGEPKAASATRTGHHGQFYPYLARTVPR